MYHTSSVLQIEQEFPRSPSSPTDRCMYGRGTFQRQPQNHRNDAAPQQQARCRAVQQRTNFDLDRYAHTILHSGLGNNAKQRCAQNIAGSLQLTQLHTLSQPTSTPDAAPRPATGTADAVPCGHKKAAASVQVRESLPGLASNASRQGSRQTHTNQCTAVDPHLPTSACLVLWGIWGVCSVASFSGVTRPVHCSDSHLQKERMQLTLAVSGGRRTALP